MNLIDLIIIAIICFAAVEGMKKRLLNSCFSFLSSIVGLFAAIKYNSVLATWIDDHFSVFEQIKQFFAENFIIYEEISGINIGVLSLPDISTFLDHLEFPIDLKVLLLKYILNMVDEVAMSATTTLGQVLNLFMSEIAYKSLVFVVMWFIVYKIADYLSSFFIGSIEGSVSDLLNDVGGIVLGLGKMIFVLTALLGMFYPVLALSGFSEPSLLVSITNTVGEAGLVRILTWLFSLLMGELIVPWL
jgi:hypothetical protein